MLARGRLKGSVTISFYLFYENSLPWIPSDPETYFRLFNQLPRGWLKGTEENAEDAGLLFMEADVIYAVTEQGDLVAQLCPQGTCLSAVPKGQCRCPRSFRFGSKSDAANSQCLACTGCFNDEHICDGELLLFFFFFGSSVVFQFSQHFSVLKTTCPRYHAVA